MSCNNSNLESESSEDEPDHKGGKEHPFDLSALNSGYLKAITDLLDVHSQVDCSNALTLNKEMQSRLQEVRQRLQSLLQAVKQRYLSNEKRLKDNLGVKSRGIGMRGAYLRGGTFYFKGNMFFKDLNCRNCPNNEDYEYRKNVEGEMFPMDFELCSRHVWSLLDKTGIVQGIKEQITDYLADRQARELKKSVDSLSRKIRVHSEKLVDLLGKVDDDFVIDWEQISAHNINYRHSPTSCKAMWQVYLHPRLKRTPWSAEENSRLLEAVVAHNYQDWISIAAKVGRRSDYQCFIQYQTTVCYMDKQRWSRWNKKDDELLLQSVEANTINGVTDWNTVASNFPQKCKTSLQQRYTDSLHPKISHEPFTAEEDLVLLATVEQYGEKFSNFPRTLFPNRSLTQLRARYQTTLQNRHNIAPWSVEDDEKLMEFVVSRGTSSWLDCAEMLGNHNRISCRTRFLTIQRFFEKNPEAALEDLPRKKRCIVKHSVITTQNWLQKVSELRENPDVDLRPPKYGRQSGKKQCTNESRVKTEIKCEKISNIDIKKTTEDLKNETIALLQKRRLQNATGSKLNTATKDMLSRRKPLYLERLRAVELRLYNFFKYAYNFRLGDNVCMRPPTSAIYVAATALGFYNETANKHFIKNDILPRGIQQRCKVLLRQPYPRAYQKSFGYSMPPSWSTTMGFRALCIQYSQVDMSSVLCLNVEVSNHSAVQTFRSRLRAVLYKTALLSRLHPNRFEGKLVQLVGNHVVGTGDDFETVMSSQSANNGTNEVTVSKSAKNSKCLGKLQQSRCTRQRKRKNQTIQQEHVPKRPYEKCTIMDLQILPVNVSMADNQEDAELEVKREM